MLNYLETNDKVTRFVEDITGMNIFQIQKQNRAKEYVEARMIMSYLFRKHNRSYPNIGRFMKRDHSTIIHLVKKVDADAELKVKIDELIRTNFPDLDLK